MGQTLIMKPMGLHLFYPSVHNMGIPLAPVISPYTLICALIFFFFFFYKPKCNGIASVSDLFTLWWTIVRTQALRTRNMQMNLSGGQILQQQTGETASLYFTLHSKAVAFCPASLHGSGCSLINKCSVNIMPSLQVYHL